MNSLIVDLIWVIIAVCTFLFIYHHYLYPKLLRVLTHTLKRKMINKSRAHRHEKYSVTQENNLPSIGILLCAYNEAEFIQQKLFNLAALQYPGYKFEIHLLLDGCTDNTLALAQSAIAQLHKQYIACQLHVFEKNKGKLSGINYLISQQKDNYDILLFSDISALTSIDALKLIVDDFEDDSVGVVSGVYQFYDTCSEQQKKYWHYQNSIKQDESYLGAVVGVPGALFAMRSELCQTLPKDTINDDFVLSMMALGEGHKSIINPCLNIIEMDQDTLEVDKLRRIRIGAGNFQQIYLLKHLFTTKNLPLKFSFLSHKVLRGLMPCFLFVSVVFLILAACFENNLFAQFLLAGLGSTSLIGVTKSIFKIKRALPIVDDMNYVLTGYSAAFYGIFRLMSGFYRSPWKREKNKAAFNQKVLVTIAKRTIDIFGSIIGLTLSIPIMMIAGAAIKLSSKGPIFYHQQRVGKFEEDFVALFNVYKLRTMVDNAEKKNGAVWASKEDPRITKVGLFLRKTRIDELPQFFNVLKGEMSLIGPRPERPVFYGKLESGIPFYSQRTFGVKPGISGLAQVMNGYDETLEDVKSKIAWDYAYVLSLCSFTQWLQMECNILVRTVYIVITGKGQ
ncbi:sugar transferase [Pseudoalteromonas denitrificans]|uniref:Sugar transferase involved in LPS biosynthesis (Colanic, teichoic acid) n=1 Tax=Pseudoalteromonas denitrificans DSM 6059 TaxID=1123010 RepID=A0A1I1EPR6_9GAMM|nr:sugar transferase [Pseudoalteromonas denitrificans]SFB89094.1 Sugar transferase involved in LPS biosynthesis (colanic, teichoic acid) [Pseudoalteromonas denitrificans DSM 6059]